MCPFAITQCLGSVARSYLRPGKPTGRTRRRRGTGATAAFQPGSWLRSSVPEQSNRASARLASSMSYGSWMPSPSASDGVSRATAVGGSRRGPWSGHRSRRRRRRPASVSRTSARPPWPSSTGPTITGAERPLRLAAPHRRPGRGRTRPPRRRPGWSSRAGSDGSAFCMASWAYPYAWIATAGTSMAAATRPAQAASASAGRAGGVGSGGSAGPAGPSPSVGAGDADRRRGGAAPGSGRGSRHDEASHGGRQRPGARRTRRGAATGPGGGGGSAPRCRPQPAPRCRPRPAVAPASRQSSVRPGSVRPGVGAGSARRRFGRGCLLDRRRRPPPDRPAPCDEYLRPARAPVGRWPTVGRF